MDHAVAELGELGVVPAVCGAYEIAGDALEAINCCRTALRAFFKILARILIAAVHASVAVMVH